ncbi:MAG: hypothetical protein KAT05_04875, partial [Spirochaetes bacterium]|nr:hypothetical protein [Spirochaetota bacterium]
MIKKIFLILIIFYIHYSLNALTVNSCTPSNHLRSTANVTYTVVFTLGADLSSDDYIDITFPAGFNVATPGGGTYADDDASTDPTINSVTNSVGQTVRIDIASGGDPIVHSGSQITVTFNSIDNTATRGSYQVTVTTPAESNSGGTFTISKRPVIQNTSYYWDNDGDGEIDRVTLNFDVNVDITDAGGAGDGFDGITFSDGATIQNGDYAANNVNTVTFIIDGLALLTTYYVALTATYTTAGSDLIYDVYGTSTDSEMANGENQILADGAAPILVDAEIDNTLVIAPNTFNFLQLTFSEPMESPSFPGSGTGNQYVSDDGSGTIASGDIGGALTTAGQFDGWGIAATGNDVVAYSDSAGGMDDSNTVYRNVARTVFTIVLGGNVSDGGCIRGNTEPAGLFTPDGALEDQAGNLIDNSVTRLITVINNWTLTAPQFNSAVTDERVGQINGQIDNIIVGFSINVHIYDDEARIG